MKCQQCRRGISKAESRKAKFETANGKLKAAYHFNCWETKKRIELLKATNRMPKNAYEVKGNNQDDRAAEERLKEAKERLEALSGGPIEEVVLAHRQVVQAEEALAEARREGWDDYRDTGTAEV